MGFSKEAFRNKDGLPEWFLDDEGKHNKPNLPVTKEAMNQLREKIKALNARPIKKVAEAKARKKFKVKYKGTKNKVNQKCVLGCSKTLQSTKEGNRYC